MLKQRLYNAKSNNESKQYATTGSLGQYAILQGQSIVLMIVEN